MKKYFSLLVLSAALFGAGCGNKKNKKAAIEQKNIVVAEESTTDKKEDYSIVA